MRKVIIIVGVITLLLAVGLWSPWLDLSIEDIVGVEDVQDFSMLYVSSLAGDLNVYLDGEAKGVASFGNDPLIINGIKSGNHKVLLERISEEKSFYQSVEKDLYFEGGIGLVMAYEVGPGDDSTAGYILTAKNKASADDAQKATIEIITNVEGAKIYLDDEKIGVSPLGKRDILTESNYAIKVTKDGYFPMEFNLFPNEAKYRDRFAGTEIIIDIDLYKIPLILDNDI